MYLLVSEIAQNNKQQFPLYCFPPPPSTVNWLYFFFFKPLETNFTILHSDLSSCPSCVHKRNLGHCCKPKTTACGNRIMGICASLSWQAGFYTEKLSTTVSIPSVNREKKAFPLYGFLTFLSLT